MYGLNLAGVDAAADAVLVRPDRDLPTLTVRQVEGAGGDVPTEFTPDRLRMTLSDGVTLAEVAREPLTATLTSPVHHDARALVHPLLAFPSAAANRWLGRDAFHAGAVVIDDGAWLVGGDKERGKTSLLGVLAAQGMTVMADDMSVVERGSVHSGPACLDLREGAADHLGVGEWIGKVGGRERWRHVLPPPPPEAPLRGFVFLSWGEETRVDVVPPAERLPLLFANQAIWRTPTDLSRFLGLAALPHLSLSRPRSWDRAEHAGEVLVDYCRRLRR